VRLTELARRKHLLIAQGEIYRALLTVERLAIQDRIESAQRFVRAYRAPLLAGSALGGILLGRKGKALLRWLPSLLTLWRVVRR
jgi:hypothetical protein